MACEEQIAKLKVHVRAVVDELEWIIQCFELVQPGINNEDLKSEFTGTKRLLGFRILKRSVARYCVIGITRLTYDRGSQKSDRREINCSPHLSWSRRLCEELKADFARPISPGEPPARPLSELDLAASEEMDKLETAEGQQTFDDHISQLKEQWQWFSEHETTFRDFRDKRLAHLDVSKYEDGYGPTEIQSLEWELAVDTLRRLIEIAKLLSAILRNEGRDFDQFQRFSQRDAKDFWQIS